MSPSQKLYLFRNAWMRAVKAHKPSKTLFKMMVRARAECLKANKKAEVRHA